jgi:hypothetical protein
VPIDATTIRRGAFAAGSALIAAVSVQGLLDGAAAVWISRALLATTAAYWLAVALNLSNSAECLARLARGIVDGRRGTDARRASPRWLLATRMLALSIVVGALVMM